MTILFLGDIVGRPGREAVQRLLPKLRAERQPDFVLANVENLAGGRGVTPATLDEMLQAGIDYFTSGNHVFHLEGWEQILGDESFRVLRPANYPLEIPGRGYTKIVHEGGELLLLNLSGRERMPGPVRDPFCVADELLGDLLTGGQVTSRVILVDLHAELTSEKNALAFYLDGKVSTVVGTHTHVPTADERILPQGTGYVTDVGMVGALNSVLGVKAEKIIEKLRFPYPVRFEWSKSGPVRFDSVLVRVDPATGRCQQIERVAQIIP